MWCYECVSSAYEGACSLLRHRCWALCGSANYQRYVPLLDAELTFSTVALTTRLAELTRAPTHSLAHTYCREILLLSCLVGGGVCSWPFTQKQPQRRSPPSPSASSSRLKVHRREMGEDWSRCNLATSVFPCSPGLIDTLYYYNWSLMYVWYKTAYSSGEPTTSNHPTWQLPWAHLSFLACFSSLFWFYEVQQPLPPAKPLPSLRLPEPKLLQEVYPLVYWTTTT